jgi:hypothetical protein
LNQESGDAANSQIHDAEGSEFMSNHPHVVCAIHRAYSKKAQVKVPSLIELSESYRPFVNKILLLLDALAFKTVSLPLTGILWGAFHCGASLSFFPAADETAFPVKGRAQSRSVQTRKQEELISSFSTGYSHLFTTENA